MAQKVLFEIKDAGDKFEFDTTIEKELNQAQLENHLSQSVIN